MIRIIKRICPTCHEDYWTIIAMVGKVNLGAPFCSTICHKSAVEEQVREWDRLEAIIKPGQRLRDAALGTGQ